MTHNFKPGDMIRIKKDITLDQLSVHGTEGRFMYEKKLKVYKILPPLNDNVVSVAVYYPDGNISNWICPNFIEKVEPNEGF